jgi:chemotaxis protein MotA
MCFPCQTCHGDAPPPLAAIQHQAAFAQGPLLPPQRAGGSAVAEREGGPGRGTALAYLHANRCVTRHGRRKVSKLTNGIDKREGVAFTRSPMLGAAFGVALLAAATIAGSDGIHSLLSLGGLVIVFGGVTAVAFMSFRPADVCKALESIAVMLKGAAPDHDVDLRRDMEDIVSWSRVVYEKGTRGLERSLARNGTADPLLRYGLNLVVSDYAQDEVRAMVETAADGGYQCACVPVEVLRAMGSHAPAFGMVGTLVGMVSMLHGLTNDAEAIGGTLAVAFLSTLYGVMSARMIYMPAAVRLERQVEAQRVRDNLIAEGMAMLASKKSPPFVRDRLNAFLHPKDRNYFNIIEGVTDPGTSALTSSSGDMQTAPQRRLLQVVNR